MTDEELARQLIQTIKQQTAPRAALLESRIEKATAYLDEITSPTPPAIAHVRRYLTGEYDDMPFNNPAATMRGLFEKRWRCEVFSSGYHNGDPCRPSDPHGGWRCEFRWIAPALTEQQARDYGLIHDTTEETTT